MQTNDILGKGAFKTVYKGFDGLEGLGELLFTPANMLVRIFELKPSISLQAESLTLGFLWHRGGMEPDTHE